MNIAKAMDELRDGEERYALALQGSNDGIWDWNIATGEVFFSDRWKAILGYGPDEISNKVEEWKTRGPIHTYSARLKAQGMLIEEQFLEIDRAANQEVEQAVAFAEAGTWEPVEGLLRDVHTSACGMGAA